MPVQARRPAKTQPTELIIELLADYSNPAMPRLEEAKMDTSTKVSTPPTIGRIVCYKLSDYDAQAINRRRDDFQAHTRLNPRDASGFADATGHVGHVGNPAAAGDVYPAVVVRVFDPSSGTANLKVLLDGTDTYWATSRMQGDGECQWAWPARTA